MTNEEAVKYGTEWLKDEYLDARDGVFIKTALEALRQEPCEDAISRQAAIDTIESWLSCDNYNESEQHIMRAMQSVLYDLPPVTPQPKMGRWIADVDKWGDIVTTVNGYRCSECNAFNTDKDNFCSNCGAKMEVDE